MSTATPLTKKECKPCEEGVPPISEEDANRYFEQLDDQWSLKENKKLHRSFSFDDFMKAMEFVNMVAEVAEAEGHHPDIYIFYNKVEITLYTHAIDALSENDFIVAAKIDQVVE